LTSPEDYQIFQRNGSNQADIIISGTTAYSDSVEARWGSAGSWTTLRTNTVTGAFLDTLNNQDAGQKTLYVRGKLTIDAVDSAQYIGVGDNYVVYGQSNANGSATNNQTWTHPILKAGNFTKDYRWKLLADPVSNPANIVDAVANCSAGGSIWPIIADSIMANYDIPVGFIPAAMDGATIAQLIPTADSLDRATLYGSMHTRADSARGVKAVLFWHGEADASQGQTQVYYNSKLDSLANSTYADFGAKLMPVKLQNCTGIVDAQEDIIRAAVVEAWTDNPNVIEGPDFSDISSDDIYHLTTNAKVDSAANRFWRKIRDNIYEAP
jgi:hypothetical protein